VSTRHLQQIGRWYAAPAIALLLAWTIVPLLLTVWFAFQHYSLFDPQARAFSGLENFEYILTDPTFFQSLRNTLVLVASVLLLTIGLGVPLALMLDGPVVGRGVLRALVIAPFFVMPTVSAVIWKNLLMDPVSGLLAWIATGLGVTPVDWFADCPLLAIILIVAWQWLPFATLVILTALQSLDQEQKEAAAMDGAGPIAIFRHIMLPHLARPIAVVVLMETIFLLGIFAEIFVTTGGGPGTSTTNMAFLIFSQALIQFDVGAASAAGLIAVVIANVVAFALVKLVGRHLEV
jgi:sorbitol/mannitol transport system permease protein